MNENDVKPLVERLKNDPSMDEILNFTQAMLNKLPETNEEKTADHKDTSESINISINKESLNSLMKAVQSIVNPATISYLSKTFKQPESKEDDSGAANLKDKVDQLSAELEQIKEELSQTKAGLADNSQNLEILETEVKYLKGRRRR